MVVLAQLLAAEPDAGADAAVADASVTDAPSSDASVTDAPDAGFLRLTPAERPARRMPFEVTAQISAGGGVRFAEAQPMADPPRAALTGLFTLALRVDFLFLRTRLRAAGVGPFFSLRSDNFADLAPAVGVSVLAPIHEAFPFVLSGGVTGRWGVEGFHPGAVERIFWGARSYNYTQSYALAIGLFVEARQYFGPMGVRDADLVAGVDLDFQSLVIPWMALYSWLFRTDPAR